MYKVLLVKNRLTKKFTYKKGIEWFKKNTPIDMQIEEIVTDFDLSFRNVANNTFSGVVATDYYKHLQTLIPEGKYNCVCLVYGNKAPGIRVSIAENTPLYPDTDVVQVVTNDDGKTLNHELFHIFFRKLDRNGISLMDPMDVALVKGVPKPYYNDKNLDAKESNRTIALDQLKHYWSIIESISKPKTILETITEVFTPKKKYKYFSDSEIIGLKPELVEMLDRAREKAGIAFVINSGYRSEEKNESVGGVKDSSHTKGEAVDLRARNSTEHFKITKALMDVGFTRISRSYPSHIHVDISGDKPQNVLF